MREETVTYKIYSFSELDPKVQEKVIEKYRYWNVEGFNWWELSVDDFKEDLKVMGFLDPEIFFSGFASQGDGACFDCQQFNILKMIESLNGRIAEKQLAKYRKYITKLVDAGMIDIYIEKKDAFYVHARSRTLRADFNSD